jgi:hypothetical protein
MSLFKKSNPISDRARRAGRTISAHVRKHQTVYTGIGLRAALLVVMVVASKMSEAD